jgi:pSer/pThr/pTyr-binding forkhead associated (FHA) protein
MPTVILRFKKNTIGQFEVEKGKSLTIGRQPSNDITIENLAVSGHHAKIDVVGEEYLLTDLKSKNSSFVNKEVVQTHWLQHKDVITIGKHNLIFVYKEGEERPAESDGAMDQTMVMDTDKYRDMLAKAKDGVSGSTQGADKKAGDVGMGVLSYLGGGEGEIELSKKLIKIGKDKGSDIVVGGMMVGATAATISKRPQGYHLAYVGGMSKPKVNGDAVKDSVLLKEFDVIELGSIKMQFVVKS